jgi:GMP synthase-like glutamine amidotransferase
MIQVIDLTDPKYTLLSDEFVLPVFRILKDLGISASIDHISTITSISDNVTGIVICGTALADLWYSTIPLPASLIEWNRPVFGICAGMQILLYLDGGEIASDLEVGMTDIILTPDGLSDPLTEGKELLAGYSLHQKTVVIPKSWKILGITNDELKRPQIVKSRLYPKYGVLFHPEVRNEWLIKRFVQIFCE